MGKMISLLVKQTSSMLPPINRNTLSGTSPKAGPTSSNTGSSTVGTVAPIEGEGEAMDIAETAEGVGNGTTTAETGRRESRGQV